MSDDRVADALERIAAALEEQVALTRKRDHYLFPYPTPPQPPPPP